MKKNIQKNPSAKNTKDNLLIAIIVPVYNAEKYLRACIDSILDQTYKNFELFLIDDCTPDNSGIICDEYAKKYKKQITVIHKKKNQGPALARRDGVFAARASKKAFTTLCFVDSDDAIHPRYFAELSQKMTPDVDIAWCGYYSDNKNIEPHSNNNKLTGKHNKLFMQQYSLEQYSLEQYSLEQDPGVSSVVLWSKLFRIELFDQLVYPTISIGEDQIMMQQIYNNARSTYFINKNLYFYRDNELSITKTINSKRIKQQLEMLDYINSFTKKNNPHLQSSLDIKNRNELIGIMNTLLRCQIDNPEEIYKEIKTRLSDYRIADFRGSQLVIRTLPYIFSYQTSRRIIATLGGIKKKVSSHRA